eukprot:TRINITY_DN76034_c0_g1_i1.p1 TRINITY_DN76034_c0_g1~~TRINITY_DN76034_c0_g1_i1.p1  ORF type:complete len:743 (+),score=100.50 TRINITY_DN76034_c0_g1_i1:47-2275(+)
MTMASTVSLKIASVAGETALLEGVSLDTIVFSLKELVAEQMGVPPMCQRLIAVEEELLPTRSSTAPAPEISDAVEAIRNAEASLDVLGKGDFQELKSIALPPAGVTLVFEAVMHLLAGVDPNIELDRKGRVRDTSWMGAMRMLGNPERFLQNLKGFKHAIDDCNVPEQNMQRARKLLTVNASAFSEAELRKKSNLAAGIGGWVHHIMAYHDCIENHKARGVMPMLELRDHEILGSCFNAGAAISLTIITTDELLKASCYSGKTDQRIAAAKAMVWYHKQDSNFSREHLEQTCVKDTSYEVRLAAAESLLQVCEDKDSLIAKMSNSLTSYIATEAMGAMEFMVRAWGREDERSVDAVVGLIKNSGDADIRGLCAALGKLSDRNADRVLGAMRVRMKKSSSTPTTMVLACVKMVSSHYEQRAIVALQWCLTDALLTQDSSSALDVLTCLEQHNADSALFSSSAQKVVKLLLAKLNHPRTAFQALVQMTALAEKDPAVNELVLTEVLRRLWHPDRSVRRTAMEHLVKYVSKDDRKVIAATTAFFEDRYEWTRCSAVHLLTRISSRGNQDVITAIVALMQKDEKAEVVQACVCTLRQSAERGDKRAVEAVSDALAHESSWVRRTAAQAMGDIAEEADEKVIELVIGCLTDTDSEVVIAAIEAARLLARKGHKGLITALTPAVHHRDQVVATAAIHCLDCVADSCDSEALAILTGFITKRRPMKPDQEVVNLAIQVREQLGKQQAAK